MGERCSCQDDCVRCCSTPLPASTTHTSLGLVPQTALTSVKAGAPLTGSQPCLARDQSSSFSNAQAWPSESVIPGNPGRAGTVVQPVRRLMMHASAGLHTTSGSAYPSTP